VTLRAVIMGVAGCGKTTVGAGLADILAVPYLDGDDLHPATNVTKMRAGNPLTDEDRWPWLALVGKALFERAPVIIGCSALRRSYRDKITDAAGGAVTFIHLSGTRRVIEARMATRQGHFMPLSLVVSQFATLEPPSLDETAITIDIDQPLAAILKTLETQLRGRTL
jgi:gluconokinase